MRSILGNLIADRQLSLRMTRKLLKDVADNFNSLYEDDYIDHIKIAERSFDKSTTAIRIAMITHVKKSLFGSGSLI